jgi:membrane protease subunit (stomatin/prohibitin family)
MPLRNVVSTLTDDGQEILGPDVLLFHYPSNDVQNGTLLTVESNAFCVLKSRGAVIDVYETGQHQVQTPQRFLLGSVQQAFYGGQSPWQYEVLYINRAKLVLQAKGVAYTREMAELAYVVDYYIHVERKEDALRLVQHMPYRGHFLKSADVNAYAAPVVEQAINQVIQVTALEQVNEKIHEITELIRQHLQEFLAVYGITLNDLKVLIFPQDDRVKALITLKAFGLSDVDAVRHYIALVMAERGLVSAPNMAVGSPFVVGGGVVPTVAVPVGWTAGAALGAAGTAATAGGAAAAGAARGRAG